MKVLLVVLALGLLAVWAADAQLVSNALGSHMVLQRAPQVSRLWGWTKTAHERVRITFNNKNYDVTSGSDRKWTHDLPATPASGPHTILVVSFDEKVLLEDVYFGDVWLCGGQSNMQFTVNTAFNATQELILANNYPHVRLLTVGQSTTSTEPLPMLKTLEQPWSVANSTSVGGKSWQHFSAVCWFFGKQLYDKYKVPIGLVSSNWGGTIVQAWSSPEALSKCKVSSEEDQSASTTTTTTTAVEQSADKLNPNENSVLWNAMIVPLLDLSLKGAIWYQGESNTGHAEYYGCAFPAMITDWRSRFFHSGRELVFLFVQLAPWLGGANTAIPDIRQAQEKALALTDVGMATAIDLGDPTSPEGNIHPRNKQEVGRRLALAADHIAYGQNVNYLNPRAVSAFAVDHTAGRARVHFDKNTLAGGLVMHNNECQVDAKYCVGYELQINRGSWVAAKGQIVEDGSMVDITASVPRDSRLTGVRYAWSDWPICTLYSKDGLPALQFNFLL